MNLLNLLRKHSEGENITKGHFRVLRLEVLLEDISSKEFTPPLFDFWFVGTEIKTFFIMYGRTAYDTVNFPNLINHRTFFPESIKCESFYSFLLGWKNGGILALFFHSTHIPVVNINVTIVIKNWFSDT